MQFNKVFISYVGDNYDAAEELYDLFQNNDLDPWLDKKKLKIGQDWNLYIQEAIEKSDFIVMLFSTKSVLKRSFYQKELRTALRLVEEKLPTDIFILPVKVEDCEIPEVFTTSRYNQSPLNCICKRCSLTRPVSQVDR